MQLIQVYLGWVKYSGHTALGPGAPMNWLCVCVWPPRGLQSAPQGPDRGPELAEGLPGERAAAADQEEETGG